MIVHGHIKWAETELKARFSKSKSSVLMMTQLPSSKQDWPGHVLINAPGSLTFWCFFNILKIYAQNLFNESRRD